MQELESGSARVTAAVCTAENSAAVQSEAAVKAENETLVARVAELSAALQARVSEQRRAESDAAEELAAAVTQAAALRRELTETVCLLHLQWCRGDRTEWYSVR